MPAATKNGLARGRAPSGRKEPGVNTDFGKDFGGTRPSAGEASGRQEAVMHDAHMDAKVLRRAAELVEQGHCKQALARAVDDEPLMEMESHNSPRASRWCIIGAMLRATTEITGERVGFSVPVGVWRPVADIVGVGVDSWNNAPERTPDEVAAVLRQAADRCDGVSLTSPARKPS